LNNYINNYYSHDPDVIADSGEIPQDLQKMIDKIERSSAMLVGHMSGVL
jgi:hypothetical protein